MPTLPLAGKPRYHALVSSIVSGLATISPTVTVSIKGPDRAGGIELQIGDEISSGTATRLGPTSWLIRFGSQSVTVDLARVGTAWRARSGNQDLSFALTDALAHRLLASAGPRGQGAGDEQVTAPIAGKVIAYPFAVGARVEPGQVVAVLEAMKMENELLAERGGVVQALCKEVGQAVAAGETIVRLGAI